MKLFHVLRIFSYPSYLSLCGLVQGPNRSIGRDSPSGIRARRRISKTWPRDVLRGRPPDVCRLVILVISVRRNRLLFVQPAGACLRVSGTRAYADGKLRQRGLAEAGIFRWVYTWQESRWRPAEPLARALQGRGQTDIPIIIYYNLYHVSL